MASIIKLKNINKSYKNKKVLRDFSLEVEDGEMVAIVGASGKGKSTLLNIIGLLDLPDSGDVIIDGNKNVKPNTSKANKILRSTISYLFQNFALVDNKSVLENLLIGVKYSKGSKKEKINNIKSVLEKVELSGYEDKKVYELSGGEQQRVAIARIMLKPSKIVLADEPTGSLDEKNRNLVVELITKINALGKTVIIVTHDKVVANACTRSINL